MRTTIEVSLLLALVVGSGCGVSTSGLTTNDAAVPRDAVGAGGTAGAGGVLPSGTTTATGGAAGGAGGARSGSAGGTSLTSAGGAGGTTVATSGRTEAGGSTAPRTGGAGAGGRGTGGAVGSGGAATGGGGGTVAGGAGGTRSGGTGGTIAGGAGGTVPGTGGSSAPRDAMADGSSDVRPTERYAGCSYIGGIDRVVVGKLDHETGMCVALVLWSLNGTPDAGFGMTISSPWGVEVAAMWEVTAVGCATRASMPRSVQATSGAGTVTVNTTEGTIDIDATLSFPASDARPATRIELKAQGVSIEANCTV